MKPLPLCRHCQRSVAHRPKRLCWVCYRTPEINSLYPRSDHPGARRGIGTKTPQNKPTPTVAIPGTLSKIEILAQRVENQEHLWHEKDFHLLDLED